MLHVLCIRCKAFAVIFFLNYEFRGHYNLLNWIKQFLNILWKYDQLFNNKNWINCAWYLEEHYYILKHRLVLIMNQFNTIWLTCCDFLNRTILRINLPHIGRSLNSTAYWRIVNHRHQSYRYTNTRVNALNDAVGWYTKQKLKILIIQLF